MKQEYDAVVAPLMNKLERTLRIPVQVIEPSPSDGPVDYDIYVRINKDWTIEELIANCPF